MCWLHKRWLSTVGTTLSTSGDHTKKVTNQVAACSTILYERLSLLCISYLVHCALKTFSLHCYVTCSILRRQVQPAATVQIIVVKRQICARTFVHLLISGLTATSWKQTGMTGYVRTIQRKVYEGGSTVELHVIAGIKFFRDIPPNSATQKKMKCGRLASCLIQFFGVLSTSRASHTCQSIPIMKIFQWL